MKKINYNPLYLNIIKQKSGNTYFIIYFSAVFFYFFFDAMFSPKGIT